MGKLATQKVLLVRSAPTEWDQVGRLQGSTDLPPSGGGLLTVQRQIAEKSPIRLSTVLCGPDESSVATAQLLADAGGAKLVRLDELAEIRFGLWEGILRSDLEERFCRAGRQWEDDPTCVTPPEGESVEALAERLLPVIERHLHKAASRRVGLPGQGARTGIVLRPFADALVRCVLAGRPGTDICAIVASQPGAEWFEVSPNHPWRLKPGPSRTPTVSAA